MSSSTKIGAPASLVKAGSRATELAGETGTAGDHPVDETRAAAKDFTGAQWGGGLGGSLADLADSWSRKTADLVRECRSLGGQCAETGRNYLLVESQNHSLMINTAKNTASDSPFG
ncbi:hypothetical protein ACFW9F_02360 [Streptomyces sp. NPDC059506]|uniref:hypothetical protein n=1 Tax=Streptomyces TaxID=1883 RepID=UPI00369A0E9F